MENSKYNYFNILRFMGAMCIAILLHWNDHMLPAINAENNLESINILFFYISKNSYVFVEMFYIISGFLFAKNYMNRINYKNGLTLKDFLSKRYIRIFPLVIISSIIIITLTYLIKVGILKYTHAWKLMLISTIIHLIVETLSYYLIEQQLSKTLKNLGGKI